MAHPDHTVIHIQSAAPAKPAPGQACNGCGVCCAWQPCPLGMLISGRRSGACLALQWQEADQRYICAMVAAPASVLPWLPGWAANRVRSLAGRWIAAGVGCDSDLEASSP